MPRRPRHAFLALLCSVTIGLMAACGAGGDGTGGLNTDTVGDEPDDAIPVAAANQRLAGMVPAEVSDDGTITVGQDQTYAPNEFVDESGKVVGFDIDLGRAVAQKLGLRAEFVNGSFDGIITGLAANKYEMGISSFSINTDRLQTIDMVSYYRAGTSLAVREGNPDNVTMDNLCGKNVVVQKGTTQVEELTEISAQCQQADRQAVNMQQFQNQTDVNLQLASKRSQAMLADSPVIDYTIKKTEGKVERVGQPHESAPYGIALAKGKAGYAEAVRGAVQALIDDGTYQKIVTKWGLNPSGSVNTSEVNSQP